MKLIAKDTTAEPQAVFNLEKDSNDINIMINGELVAYFEVFGDKIRLQLVNRPLVSDKLHMDGNYMVVIR